MNQIDYVLIGAGVASVWAAQTIRERDPNGRILIIGSENHPPYDRPPLSKRCLLSDEWQTDDCYSKYDDFYPKNQVELKLGVPVSAIDRSEKQVVLDNGERVGYRKLLIATGSRARLLDLPNQNLPGVFCLRSLDEAEAVREAMRGAKRAVIDGAGYLGMEIAAAFAQKGIETVVVESGAHPWSQFATPTLGQFIQNYYENQGVQFKLGITVKGLEGEGSLKAVQLSDGDTLPADLIVLAVGATLNVELAAQAGLAVDPSQGIVVDENLRSEDPAIWAAGDVACFPDPISGNRGHAEHHLNAKWQGRAVGATMAGETQPYDQVRYFYSDVFDLHLCVRGEVSTNNRTELKGDAQAGEFVEFFVDDQGAITGAFGLSHDEPKLDKISDQLESLIRAKASPNEFQFPQD